MDFGLFVFERNIAVQDVAVLEFLGHVSVTSTVIEHETLDESSVGGELVDHVHSFNHVQVNRAIRLLDAEDGINNDFNELVGDIGMELSVQ